jgi:hypothetical protein
MGSVTNAQVMLPAGSYTVRVELNGMRKTQKVDVANGNTNYVKFILSQ